MPSEPCSRILRLLAIFSESRKSVSSNNNVGKTLNSTARRICTAERKTTIEAAIDKLSRKSSAKAGSGTSITKITLMVTIGSTYSRSRFKNDPAGKGPAAMAVVLIGNLL